MEGPWGWKKEKMQITSKQGKKGPTAEGNMQNGNPTSGVIQRYVISTNFSQLPLEFPCLIYCLIFTMISQTCKNLAIEKKSGEIEPKLGKKNKTNN